MRIKRQFDTFSLRSPSEDLLVRGEEGFVLPTGIVPGDSGDDTGDNGDGGGLLTNLLPVLFPLPPALPQVSTTTVQAVVSLYTLDYLDSKSNECSGHRNHHCGHSDDVSHNCVIVFADVIFGVHISTISDRKPASKSQHGNCCFYFTASPLTLRLSQGFNG